MSLTKYGPGKYDLNIDAFTHAITLDGCCEETGDVSENGVWYAKVEGPLTEGRDVNTTRGEYSLSVEDWNHLVSQAGAIVSENDQGFVTVEYFESADELAEKWDSIEASMSTDEPEEEPEEEEEEEPEDAPEEGDLFTEDYRKFYECGKTSCFEVRLGRGAVVEVEEGEDWKTAVSEYMDTQQFWPNVWQVSDHGNVELVTWD